MRKPAQITEERRSHLYHRILQEWSWYTDPHTDAWFLRFGIQEFSPDTLLMFPELHQLNWGEQTLLHIPGDYIDADMLQELARRFIMDWWPLAVERHNKHHKPLKIKNKRRGKL